MYHIYRRPRTRVDSLQAGGVFGRLGIGGLILLLLCSLGVHQVKASTLPTSQFNRERLTAGVDLQAIGYQSQWLASLQAQAERAMSDNSPYLAVRLWALLAEQGDPEAAFKLGLYYDVDEDQERDARHAVYWYQRAAAAGEIHAQHNLAVAYAKGDGVAMDINQAIKWWTLAARRGNADSQYNLGILYAMGEFGIKQDIDQAKHWWRKAALHGDAMAQYNLGTLYVNSGNNDYCEATRWWQEAARRGVEQANMALRAIRTRQDYHDCR